MDQLWAPWRLSYVVKEAPPTPGEDCFICRGLRETDDRRNLIVKRSAHSVVIANRFPYSNGHLLISPQAHKATFQDLSHEELLDANLLVRDMIATLQTKMKPDGFNVGINLGKVAGAGLPGHLHWHVVPRWSGDVNFMPIFAETQVIVQSLDALFDLLTK